MRFSLQEFVFGAVLQKNLVKPAGIGRIKPVMAVLNALPAGFSGDMYPQNMNPLTG